MSSEKDWCNYKGFFVPLIRKLWSLTVGLILAETLEKYGEMATFWCLCWKERVRFGHEVLQNLSRLIQSLSEYLLALLASSTCVVVCSVGLQRAPVGVQKTPIPELKAQRKDGVTAKTLVWAVGDLGPVLALCQHVPCAKKRTRKNELLPFCHLSWCRGLRVLGMCLLEREEDERRGGGGRASGGRDLVLLEITLVSCATLQLS